jgi:asparagine synthase (glutamine-hydrolysing)
MCGILAILGRGLERESLEQGLKALEHRGPDHQAVWQKGIIGLAHARLSVIDLEGGHQPLHTSDGRLSLVANGEFYEHDRQLKLLRARGHEVLTQSDSELVLHFYREMGLDCLRLLRGEFAFCLWDADKRRLFAARDRFGIKPLFFAKHKDRLYLGSEAKALWAAGVPAGWCDRGVFQSLHICRHQDTTLFKGIEQVPPGHYLLADEDGLRIERYWDQNYTRSTLDLHPLEAVAEVERRLVESVRIRTRSDVKLACYLSGGVDSSSVLALAQRYSATPVAAFTVSFEHRDYDESRVAQEMARSVNAEFYQVRVSGQDMADAFVPTVLAGENVIYNGHAPARWLLSQALRREGYKVALGGEGADEMFAGYHFSQRALTGRPSPLSLLGKLLRPSTVSEIRLGTASPALKWAVRLLGLPNDVVDYLSDNFFSARDLFDPTFLKKFQGVDPYREFLAQFPWRKLWRCEPVKQVLYLWMHSAFLSYVLAAERLDMSHAVELRLPFLDHHFFEFAKDLPASLLSWDNQNKYLLRQAVAPYVTSAVLKGTKKPFLAPPSTETPFQKTLKELATGPEIDRVPFLKRPRVLSFVDGLMKMSPERSAAYDPLLSYLASLVVLQGSFKKQA